MTPVVSRAGDRGLLLDFGSIDAAELHAHAAALRERADVLACIPGARSLYVVFDDRPDMDFALGPVVQAQAHSRQHQIEVNFNGLDLTEFFGRVPPEEFFRRLPELELTARYLGFRAAFAYLDGWPADWSMPRRPTSRSKVARGTFAIAANAAGFYPIDSPGGWNLLGQTDARLWDASCSPPNLIAAGDRIRIIAVDRKIELAAIVAELPERAPAVKFTGALTTAVTRPDWTRIREGRSPGGAFDVDEAEYANALVGNDPDAPLLECAMAGPRIALESARLVAWCGADSDLPQATAFSAAGTLEVGRIRNGLRGWLAIGEAGIDAKVTLSRLRPERNDRLTIRVAAGPHSTPLREVTCEVTPQLNRVGIRLRPLGALPVSAPADLPSCGMQFGTIQLHPDGTLVAMGPDHPITGGYLQPLTVLWGERWKLAQLSPGERVTFVCVDLPADGHSP
ncbi:MAG: carboxyltransferase domain-containing protein [Gammaproteobacteria bacterium]